MTHLLVTNDFPPKVGGIQSYLWELWRRLPPGEAHVLTTPYRGAAAFDAAAPLPIRRVAEPWLLPHRATVRRVNRLADEAGAELVVLDPAVPLGLIGPRLGRPYAVVLHGAEVTVPGRLPLTGAALRRVLLGASLVLSAGEYPAAEARRAAGQELPVRVVPPGVDADRFRPPTAAQRRAARLRLGVPEGAPLVVSVSRLVPRKGMDVLIRAAASLRSLHPDLQVLISGAGRDRRRLQHLVEAERAPVRLLGRIADDDLVALYGAADVFAMLCRTRWAGLEQEGFGIVFLEAAACGVAQICGASGGAAEAVAHGESGLVVDAPGDVRAVEAALQRLLGDEALRARMGRAARARVESEFSYDRLARTLGAALHDRAPF